MKKGFSFGCVGAFFLVVSMLTPSFVLAEGRSFPVPKVFITKGKTITADMLEMKDEGDKPATSDTLYFYDQVVGKQARRTLMPQKTISVNDIGEPVIVKRNASVPLVYSDGAVLLSATGRALDEGGAGDNVRVMNLTSRKIVTGIILPTGEIDVTGTSSPRVVPSDTSVVTPDLPESQATIH